MPEPAPPQHARFDLDEHLMHDVRLALLAILVESETAEFGFLRDTLQVSDSVLSKQASILETAGYIEIIKGRQGRRPLTRLAATRDGITALDRHRDALQRIIAAAP